MQFNSLNINQVNSSTLLGLEQCCNVYPRVSHGAILLNALQALSYPPNGGLTKIATGATPGIADDGLMNPEVGSTSGLHLLEIIAESLSEEQKGIYTKNVIIK